MNDEELFAGIDEELPDYEFLTDDFAFTGFEDETCDYIEVGSEDQNADLNPVTHPITPTVLGQAPVAPRAHVHAHVTACSSAAMQKARLPKKGKKRGSYNCGKCGMPKKGHVCVQTTPPSTPLKQYFGPSHGIDLDKIGSSSRSHPLAKASPNNTNDNVDNENDISPVDFPIHRRQTSAVCGAKRSLSMGATGTRTCDLSARKRRGVSSSSSSSNRRHGCALQCHDADFDSVDSMHLENPRGSGWLEETCLVEVFKRLPPSSLLAARMVSTQFRQCVCKVLSGVTETQILVTRDQKRYIPIMLKDCPNLVHLTLDVKSEIDDYLLRSIARSTHCLASLEIQNREGGINMVTGDGLNHLVAECNSLCSLKVESCKAVRNINISSTHLTTLWMADCYSIKTMVINCPSLTELSLEFAVEDDGSTDLCTLIENLSKTSPRLFKLHIASFSLNDSTVLALSSANFRFLGMLSLTLGSGITDESCSSMASSWNNLQILDLSGSSITDRGLGIICNAFSGTLTRLLIAACHQISIAGIQMVATQLPFLQLLDCGNSVFSKPHTKANEASSSAKQQEQCRTVRSVQKQNPLSKENKISNRLVIKHLRLRTLSLWGCTGIHALYLDCPDLVQLNLNSCSSLNPDNMFVQCPALQAVHVANLKAGLARGIQNKINCYWENETLHFSQKRMADGSKRVQAPQFGILQSSEDGEVEKDSLPQHL